MKWTLICYRKSISILAALLIAGPSHAEKLLDSLELTPYVGAEYQYQHIKSNKVWQKFMPANLQNGAIFFGNKYHKNFGIELGFYHSLKKAQGCAALQDFNGIAATGSTTVFGQIRNKGFSIDWNVYFPLDKEFNLMASLGFVSNHPNIELVTTSSSDLATSLSRVKGKNKTLFRPGVGAEYRTKNWGMRGRVFAVSTQKMALNVDHVGTKFTTITEDAFKQSFVITAGVFYIF